MPYIGAGIQRFNTASGLTVNGDADFSGNADFGDSDKVQLGASQDLQIFHDGSHSRIAEAGTGDLKIGTSGGAVRITANGVTDDMIVANQGGAVSVSHSGSTKLATSSTGVTITGDLTVGDSHTIGDDANDNLTLTSSSGENIKFDSAAGNHLFFNNGTEKARFDSSDNFLVGATSTAASDFGIKFLDDGTSKILAIHRQASDGDYIRFARGGTSHGSIKPDTGNIVINATSDFQIETNDGTKVVHVDANGSVGLGTTSPNVELEIAGSGEMLRLQSSDTNKASIRAIQSGGGDRWQLGTLDSNDSVTLQASNSTGELIFETGGANERARISSGGRMSIGTTSTSFRFNVVSDQSDYVAQFDRNVDIDGNFRNHIKFSRGGTAVGEIKTSQSATQYGTSSDHRLKENVEDMTGAIARVKQLSPKRFSWIVDDLDAPNFDGFLAHEAQTVVPQAVSGTHNAVDDDGNPVMQGIDHSMLVPLLTGALQEAIAEIETLKTKVAALEGE